MNDKEKLEAIEREINKTGYTPFEELTKEEMHKALIEINHIIESPDS